jgi:hypothetical protein
MNAGAESGSAGAERTYLKVESTLTGTIDIEPRQSAGRKAAAARIGAVSCQEPHRWALAARAAPGSAKPSSGTGSLRAILRSDGRPLYTQKHCVRSRFLPRRTRAPSARKQRSPACAQGSLASMSPGKDRQPRREWPSKLELLSRMGTVGLDGPEFAA